jgi:hypothetical protein
LLLRQNFKQTVKHNLEDALELTDWSQIHAIKDVDKAHKFLTNGITAALNRVAPLKSISVRPGANTYLAADTLALAAATAVNRYYVDKVDVICAGIACAPPPPPSTWPRQLEEFNFAYASAGRVTMIVRKMGTT